MKKSIFRLCLVLSTPAWGIVSFVYNLRIAETTRRMHLGQTFPQESIGTVTLIDVMRKTYNGIDQNCGGALFSLAHAPESYYVRVDGAVGHIRTNGFGLCTSRTQGDDLLFSGGYSPNFSERTKFTFSGMVGFPTHCDTSLQQPQFGFGEYAIGGQIDGAFLRASNPDHTFRAATRLIHFFPRTVTARLGTRSAQFYYGSGNVADLFVAFSTRKNRQNFEIGYDATFVFGTEITPYVAAVIEQSKIIRNTFYAVYRYSIPVHDTIHFIAAALSYGFDSRPKIFGNKRILTVWASWSIAF